MKDAGRPGGTPSADPRGGAGAGWSPRRDLPRRLSRQGSDAPRPAGGCWTRRTGSGGALSGRPGARGGRQLGELLGGQLFEGAAVAIEAGLEPLGDLAELGGVDHRGEFRELGRVEVAQFQPLSIELEL